VDVTQRFDRRFPAVCSELYLLAQDADPATGPERGWRWERRIADTLASRGFVNRRRPPKATPTASGMSTWLTPALAG
jgi:hypothetical protein